MFLLKVRILWFIIVPILLIYFKIKSYTYLIILNQIHLYIYIFIPGVYRLWFQRPSSRAMEILRQLQHFIADNIPAGQPYWVFSIGALICILLLRIFLLIFFYQSDSSIPNFLLKRGQYNLTNWNNSFFGKCINVNKITI